MGSVELAVSSFQEGALCSQALFSTCAVKLGLDRETAMKIATPFGGGMARLGETCGAVTGALMVIGLKYGNMSN
ncbi:MAG: C-GCAxxG-C-C family protein [Bacillota bacterium]